MKRGLGLIKVVSGGQTGVDRAALDWALTHRMEVGGWCPRGRIAEDGCIPTRYPLSETPASSYAQRTIWNVRDSDGTLILFRTQIQTGTALASDCAISRDKPLLHLNLEADPPTSRLHTWLNKHKIQVLNVAGPRESETPGIYKLAYTYLDRAFRK